MARAQRATWVGNHNPCPTTKGRVPQVSLLRPGKPPSKETKSAEGAPGPSPLGTGDQSTVNWIPTALRSRPHAITERSISRNQDETIRRVSASVHCDISIRFSFSADIHWAGTMVYAVDFRKAAPACLCSRNSLSRFEIHECFQFCAARQLCRNRWSISS